jgi:hypothetical protein
LWLAEQCTARHGLGGALSELLAADNQQVGATTATGNAKATAVGEEAKPSRLGTGIWLVGQSEVGSHFWMAVALKFTGQGIQLDAGKPQFRLSGRFCPEELIERMEQLSRIEV